MAVQEPVPVYGTPPPEEPPVGYRPETAPPQTVPAQTVPPTPAPAPAPPRTTWVPGSVGGPPPRSPLLVVRVLGILLAAGTVATGVSEVAVQFFRQSETRSSTITAPVTRLVADTGTGFVHVHRGEAGQPVRLTSALHWAFRRPTLQTATTGGVLTVAADCPWTWIGRSCSVDVDVTVPAGTVLQLRTTTGDITAASTGAAVDARATTGDVDVTADGSAPVHASATTGDVDVVSTGTAAVDADTSTGDVTLRAQGAGSNLSASTSTGDVNLTAGGVPASVRTTTSTGDITLTIPPGTTYLVDARSDTGDVSVAVPRDDASPHLVYARASTGDVVVRNP